ncbi:MAG: hypothetical protein C0599_11840 [Salinivirgaceae bacterium]|nr:MAG: hypothetical protein C0599_11840 [Salinivirgaceae bacterium]
MKNNQIENIATIMFNSGYNCSQAVLSTFAESLAFSKETAINLAAGFGAGMGRLQNTCGAVTGAYMAIGQYCGKIHENNKEVIEASYNLVQEFDKRFIEIHQTTQCKQLIHCDLKTEEGQAEFKQKNLKRDVCEVCVADAVTIVSELINN